MTHRVSQKSHSILWAPWRKTYILRVSKKKRCVFCAAWAERNDKKNKIIKRSKHAFAILNTYPYNNGHIMVIPNRHVAGFEHLSDGELLDLMRLQNAIIALLKRRMKPHGFNVGVNLGRSAGAGVVGHVHIHILPRWIGDTNFMPMVARAKVISESLASLYERLTK